MAVPISAGQRGIDCNRRKTKSLRNCWEMRPENNVVIERHQLTWILDLNVDTSRFYVARNRAFLIVVETRRAINQPLLSPLMRLT